MLIVKKYPNNIYYVLIDDNKRIIIILLLLKWTMLIKIIHLWYWNMYKYNEPNNGAMSPIMQDQFTLVKDGIYIPDSDMQGLICDNSSEL